MEDVWVTVLQPFVVHSDHPETDRLEPARVIYPESAQLTELTSPTPELAHIEAPEGTISNKDPVLGPQTLTEHLAESAQRVLEVLTRLLEWSTGSLPAELLGRIENSLLLSVKYLQDDAESLHRIKAILDRSSIINIAFIQPFHSNASILILST